MPDPLVNKGVPDKTTKLFGSQCLRYPERTPVRQVSFFARNQPSPHHFTERIKRAIDSPKGQRLYGQRMATAGPVFANLRHNKRLDRFTWHLYCLVHNIEKPAKAGFGQ